MTEEKEKARLDQEIATALTVQKTFFKDHDVQNEGLFIKSHHIPATECGGDWWGRFSLGPGKELILIGDATDQGVPAALVTAIAYTTVNLYVQELAGGRFMDSDPAAVLQSLNRLLCTTLKGSSSMTFMAMVFDSTSNSLYFSNAGHPFPIFIPENPEDERNVQGKYPFRFLIQKNKSSNLLGIDPNSKYANDVFDIKPGDKFVIHSHGLIEVKDPDGRRWGPRGIEKFLKKNCQLEAEKLCQNIIQEVTQFNARKDVFSDDLTVLVVQYAKTGFKTA